MKQYNDLIADFWRDYAALLMLAAGLAGLIALVGLGIWAKRSRKPLRPIALAFSMNLALLLNAEGMWVIAIDQLKLPKVFAVLVFAVFEICFLTATSLAAEQYRRTTVYGPDGKIVTPGHPGPMLWIAALIAAISGIIVASNAVTGTEKLLRLAVPCVIFLMWWAALTAAGQRVRRGRFAYSPRRLAERWGWLIPDDDPDLVRMAAERQVRRMVVNHHRVSGARWPKSWWRSRLLKDARTAGEPVVQDVVEQLARIQRVMDLLVPGGERFVAPAPALLPTGEKAEPVVAAPVETPDREDPAPAVPMVQPVQFMQPVQPVATEPETMPEAVVTSALDVPAPRRPAEDEAGNAPVTAVAPVSPAAPAVPSWASTPTGARPAVSIVGSPWWRLAVQNLSRLLARESTPDELLEMSYLQVTELARTLAPKVPELGEGVVRAFVIDYVRELSGEHGEAAYPWRDLLPEPALAPKGSPAWLAGLEALRSALEEEIGQGEPRDPRELAELLAPSAPRLDDVTIRGFVADYLLALGGQSGPGSAEEWQHLLPRPQSGRGASDEEILEVYGPQLDDVLRSTGRLSRYRVQSLTGVKSRVQADRIKATVEERAAAPVS
ncbi:MFS transporter [Actinoplanes sp. NBC_00393]|uniref:MFS transporter n=1 Tax=Actinoplanes sp. NBC_00393 TaxID=2975953 RepID=UPI002E1DB133